MRTTRSFVGSGGTTGKVGRRQRGWANVLLGVPECELGQFQPPPSRPEVERLADGCRLRVQLERHLRLMHGDRVDFF